MSFDLNKLNPNEDEYGSFSGKCYSSFTICLVHSDIGPNLSIFEARAYIESSISGGGREAFDALQYMIRQAAIKRNIYSRILITT